MEADEELDSVRVGQDKVAGGPGLTLGPDRGALVVLHIGDTRNIEFRFVTISPRL